jgi:hypothetical protein
VFFRQLGHHTQEAEAPSRAATRPAH